MRVRVRVQTLYWLINHPKPQPHQLAKQIQTRLKTAVSSLPEGGELGASSALEPLGAFMKVPVMCHFNQFTPYIPNHQASTLSTISRSP